MTYETKVKEFVIRIPAREYYDLKERIIHEDVSWGEIGLLLGGAETITKTMICDVCGKGIRKGQSAGFSNVDRHKDCELDGIFG